MGALRIDRMLPSRPTLAWPRSIVWCLYGFIVFLTLAIQLGPNDLTFNTAYRPFNDHFGYLTMAQQVALGELPLRDFLDHGAFLHILTSAALQVAFGHQLLAEMLMCWLFITLGNALTLYLCSRLSGSYVIGFVTALTSTLVVPRAYSFPKVFLYPLAILIAWRYVKQPGLRTLFWLAGGAAAALLFRIDHGVAVFVSAFAVVGAAHVFESPRRAFRELLVFSLMFLAWLAPYLLYVQLTVGLVEHATTILEFGMRAMGRSGSLRFRGLPVSLEILSPDVGVTLIFNLFLLITVAASLAAIVRMALDLWHQRRLSVHTLSVLAALSLWLLAAPMLARDNFYARAGDVAPMVMILGAWLVGELAGRSGHNPASFSTGETGLTAIDDPPRRRKLSSASTLRYGLSTASLLVLLGSVLIWWGGPGAVVTCVRDAWRDLGGAMRVLSASPPFDAYPSRRPAAEYGYECTERDDRLLVTWYAPEITFLANRRFAGDQWVYVEGFRNSLPGQYRVLRKMQQQSIPLVFMRPGDDYFRDHWSVLAAYVEREYEKVGTLHDVDVFASKGRSTSRTFGPGQLPCFRSPE